MSTTDLDIAVVGATGAVGEVMLKILAERDFTSGTVHALASERSVGKRVEYGDRNLRIADLATFDFSTVALALFSAGGSVSAEYAPRAADAGCVVVDNTSHFRYDDDIPLVVAEVNPDALDGFAARNLGAIVARIDLEQHLAFAEEAAGDEAGRPRDHLACDLGH